MEVAVLVADSNGGYPVPASKGGAVSTLVENLLKGYNVSDKKVKINIITYFDSEAYKLSEKYNNTNFIWIKIPKVIELIDKVVFEVYRKIFPRKKAISYKSIASLLYYIIKTRIILKKNNYDRIIIENSIPIFLTLKGLKKIYKDKYILHLHNVPRTTAKCGELIRNSKAILCVSNYVGKKIESNNNPIGPISKEKIKILYNCLDIEKFKKYKSNDKKILEYKFKYGINEINKVILFTGRLTHEKGVDKLLEAVKLLNNSNLIVLIVGSIHYGLDLKDEYYYKIKQLSENQTSKIIFTGYVENNDLPYLYNIADITVLPSMWDEPAGLTMIESMACGTPVITTNSGGILEYVSDGGIVIDRDENIVNNIAYNLEILLKDEEKREKLGNKGMIRVQKEFSYENYFNKFISII